MTGAMILPMGRIKRRGSKVGSFYPEERTMQFGTGPTGTKARNFFE